ncbi:MAG: hypothetical protein WCV92_02495 [Candidatus Buchananbacteria bacterium]
MIYIIILIIIAIAIGGYLAFMIFRHFPDLKNLDINSISNAKQGATRAKILESKFQRSSQDFRKHFNAAVGPKLKSISLGFARMKEKVVALEARYKIKDVVKHVKEPKTVEEIIEEGRALMNKEEFVAAEKKLIEAVSADKKNIKAYESLGELYFDNKCYDQAEEIYKYLIKLYTVSAGTSKKGSHFKNGKLQEMETDLLNSINVDPRVAVYYCDLAKISEATKKEEKALDSYLKASAIEPNNPKYLDKIIALAVSVRDRDLAKKTLYHLKKINPENGKLQELELSIENI